MIFYFSAAGNSLWVARELAKAFDTSLISIPGELDKEGELSYSIAPDEKVFFVFPVHSWGPAVLVKRFVARLRLNGYDRQSVYSICTCGDDCGQTDRLMAKYLSKRGIRQTACYSVTMPNTYILMPGFGIDTPEVERKKLTEANDRLKKIVQYIEAGEKTGKAEKKTEKQMQGQPGENQALYHPGGAASLKTRIVYPLFTNYAVGSTRFHVTQDRCTSCGKCAKICPTHNISLVDGLPRWGEDCVQCTACINRCPQRAIEYGRITQKMGRYHHPELK